jgi:hypothetical protein
MKRISDFKGYRTETAYDAASGTFVQVRIDIAGFEHKREGKVVPFVRRSKPLTVKRRGAEKILRETLV